MMRLLGLRGLEMSWLLVVVVVVVVSTGLLVFPYLDNLEFSANKTPVLAV